MTQDLLTTRRAFGALFVPSASVAIAAAVPIQVPVHRVVDSRGNCSDAQLRRFWWDIWPEAIRQFSRCGIAFATSDAPGEIRRSPSGRPIFVGVRRDAHNVIVTKELPLGWTRGRGMAGVTTIWDGYHVSVIAMDHAHVNRIPVLAVNTLVHEMLHALLQDVFVVNPTWSEMQKRELRANLFATELWWGGCPDLRQSTESYVRRLRTTA